MTEKIYVNKVSVKTGKYGLKLSGKSEDVIKQIQQHTNEKGYFNWDINPRKEPGKYGETHSVTVNTWEPGSNGYTAKAVNQQESEDLPF